MLTISLVTGLAGAQPALADRACETPHCYSIGQLFRSDFTGIYGHWHSNNMYLTNAEYATGSHINSEMWLLMPNNTWVEDGIRNGNDPGNPCGCTAYEVFWADESTGGGFFRHFIANVTPDGTDHWYMIQRGSSANRWDVYYDGYLQGTSTVTGSWTGNQQQIGGEVQAHDLATAWCDWFQMTAEFRDGANNWYWTRAGASVPTQSVDAGFTGYWVDSDWVWWKH
ncbi:hypothetical protein ACFQ1S_08245 [Kibdelosporangium lantanae]|uniref:Uncharacterized protein n=1 Tax=Kibdelosporangium lantanae TaxID=1497396 RepID=A0ABW3M5J7_9PSEU